MGRGRRTERETEKGVRGACGALVRGESGEVGGGEGVKEEWEKE